MAAPLLFPLLLLLFTTAPPPAHAGRFFENQELLRFKEYTCRFHVPGHDRDVMVHSFVMPRVWKPDEQTVLLLLGNYVAVDVHINLGPMHPKLCPPRSHEQVLVAERARINLRSTCHISVDEPGVSSPGGAHRLKPFFSDNSGESYLTLEPRLLNSMDRFQTFKHPNARHGYTTRLLQRFLNESDPAYHWPDPDHPKPLILGDTLHVLYRRPKTLQEERDMYNVLMYTPKMEVDPTELPSYLGLPKGVYGEDDPEDRPPPSLLSIKTNLWNSWSRQLAGPNECMFLDARQNLCEELADLPYLCNDVTDCVPSTDARFRDSAVYPNSSWLATMVVGCNEMACSCSQAMYSAMRDDVLKKKREAEDDSREVNIVTTIDFVGAMSKDRQQQLLDSVVVRSPPTPFCGTTDPCAPEMKAYHMCESGCQARDDVTGAYNCEQCVEKYVRDDNYCLPLNACENDLLNNCKDPTVRCVSTGPGAFRCECVDHGHIMDEGRRRCAPPIDVYGVFETGAIGCCYTDGDPWGTNASAVVFTGRIPEGSYLSKLTVTAIKPVGCLFLVNETVAMDLVAAYPDVEYAVGTEGAAGSSASTGLFETQETQETGVTMDHRNMWRGSMVYAMLTLAKAVRELQQFKDFVGRYRVNTTCDATMVFDRSMLSAVEAPSYAGNMPVHFMLKRSAWMKTPEANCLVSATVDQGFLKSYVRKEPESDIPSMTEPFCPVVVNGERRRRSGVQGPLAVTVLVWACHRLVAAREMRGWTIG